MSTRIVGASVWEQALYDHVYGHIEAEQAIVHEYAHLAESARSEALRYLAGLILEDERRHHRSFVELAQSIKAFAELGGEARPIPPLRGLRDEGPDALALTEKFIGIEEDDLAELRRIERDLEEVRDTSLWALVVQLMMDDTRKHLRILRFVRDRLREKD